MSDHRILTGDCRVLMPSAGPFDLIIADPPYGDTSLAWDTADAGFLTLAARALKPTGSIWLFGSLRFFIEQGAAAIADADLRYAQDVVWEKHNGSGLLADRFKRVHEHVVQLYRLSVPWASVWNAPQTTPDAVARRIHRKRKPTHFGAIGDAHYESIEGGDRLMRSVIPMRSMHGRAIHPTEKPSALMEILIRTSCPPDGLVGDWFAGSGSAGEACRHTGRRYIGCEIDPAMARRASDRLAQMLPFGGAAA
jgi:site-specific DNA-methyltransferase (adenine-specific)